MRTGSWRRLAVAAVTAAVIPAVMLVVGVLACGPDFEPEVFVPEHRPEAPKLYADGHLGVLQPGYFHAELVVAYRYLTGANLSDAEKNAYVAHQNETSQERDVWSGPAVNWLRARQAAEHIPTNNQPISYMFEQERTFKTTKDGTVQVDFELNCGDAAFDTAVSTLQQRTGQWGAQSPELMEWLHGQDAVFSNCSKEGMMPDAAKPDWPVLLRQDRAYQVAAAKFYAADYDGAIADFEAIAKDKASPWSVWGEYLAARAEVRKAAAVAPAAGFDTSLGNFDPAGLKAAETRLLKLEQQTKNDDVHHAAQAELDFVEVRLNPGKRLDQLSTALAGPKPDQDFAQDFADLDYLMDRGVTGDSSLVRWITEMQSSGPTAASIGVPGAVPSKRDALSVWREQRSVPWLVAAMIEAQSEDAALMQAAAAVKRDSPAYATVNYHRIDLMLRAKQTAEARQLADTVIGGMGPETMASTRNAFLAERIQTARSLQEFLADAPRSMIESESSAAELLLCTSHSPTTGCTAKIPTKQFDADAAGTLNTQLPLALWQQAAQSKVLPQNLRDAVAWAAWLRAVGLGDAEATKQLSALLPNAVRKTAGESDGFSATLALLRNPGLRPYLDQGVQRSATFANLDSFRDNWWCGQWTDGGGKGGLDPDDGEIARAPAHADFLTPSEKKQATDEAGKLNALPQGTVWMGRRAIAYVKAHPDDKDAAEALALTVRATHYSCSGQSDDPVQRAMSKEAFDLLHSLYPKSPWALRTKYYY